jgi:predicted RND superfamily exporter protein
VCTAIAASSIYFIKKVEVNSSLLQEIPKKNPVLDDYKFMETDFAGTRPFELELTFIGQNTTFFDIQNLLLIEKIERFIKDSCGVGNLISPLSLFRGANKAFYAGNNDYFTLPNSQEQVIRFYEAISQTEHAD